MDNVVYILGAGFSAPLGLPLINNFLVKAKDMFANNPDRYRHFTEIFRKIEQMHVAKSYFRTDLFNIEEILSILEMREVLAGSELTSFIRFIKDVISYYTPAVPPLSLEESNWWHNPFRERNDWAPYLTFVANLLDLKVSTSVRYAAGRRIFELHSEPLIEPVAKYGIISLNYD